MIFKIKYFLVVAFAIILCSKTTAQRNLKSYVQKIDGTELEITMQAIPGGEFKMGSNSNEKGHYENEAPIHKVIIEPFYMSAHEITWGLYKLFLQRNIDDISNRAKGDQVSLEVDAVSGATIPYVDMSLGMGTDSDSPVVNVTYLAAQKFCEWLSAKTGHFYRLPTEAEWEYAARAGSQTPYHFGNDLAELDKYAWYEENSDGHYHKVGSKEPNEWGLYDMHGNVAEWTLDAYDPNIYTTRKEKTINPFVVPAKQYPHVVRGGSFLDEAEFLRSAARLGSTEAWKMRDPQFPKSLWWNTDAHFVGFRIVRSLEKPTHTELEKYWGPRTL